MSAGDFSSPDGSRLASRRVSVLIPVYKGEAFVAKAVQSALNQSFPDVEVVIVNDGSPDDSRRVLEPFMSLPNVRYVEKPNGGVASARNAGLRVATGCYVALLDQDDAWLPNKLERQVALLESRPEVALVHADVTYIGPDDGVLPHDPHFPVKVEGRCFREFFIANPVMACTALVRRSVLDEVGSFDEAIRFSDDYDLWLRIVRRHAVAYVDEPLALYRVHDSNESRKIVGIVSATMEVLRKALRTMPECRETVGRCNVRKRFARLHCALARDHFRQNAWSRFSVHWLRAAMLDWPTVLQLGLPEPVRDRLRWYSKRLGFG